MGRGHEMFYDDMIMYADINDQLTNSLSKPCSIDCLHGQFMNCMNHESPFLLTLRAGMPLTPNLEESA